MSLQKAQARKKSRRTELRRAAQEQRHFLIVFFRVLFFKISYTRRTLPLPLLSRLPPPFVPVGPQCALLAASLLRSLDFNSACGMKFVDVPVESKVSRYYLTERISLCEGKKMGPHEYLPVYTQVRSEDTTCEHVCWLTVLSRELEHTEDDDGSRLRGPQDAC